MTTKIEQIFGKPRIFIPVIHACSFRQVFEQAELAKAVGADGVFIINQGGMDPKDVAATASELATSHLEWFVGVNLLGMWPLEALEVVRKYPRLKGLWSDAADARNWAQRSTRWNVPNSIFGGDEPDAPPDFTSRLYFGGVAFKGQPGVPADRYGAAAKAAADLGVDVVTTSGIHTGQPPGVAKIRAMRAAIGDHPLAIASGIDANNVGAFLPTTDAFIVASSIERRLGELDRDKTAQLAELIHGWRNADQVAAPRVEVNDAP